MAKVTYQKYAHGARGWQLVGWFVFYYILIDRLFFYGYIPFIETFWESQYVSIVTPIFSYDPSGGGNWLDVFSGGAYWWPLGTMLVSIFLASRMPYNFVSNLRNLF